MPLQQYFESLEKKKFTTISLLYVVGVCGLAFGITILFYQKMSHLSIRIAEVNDLRDEARIVREKAQQVQAQRSAVNSMLSEDRDFKIGQFFNDLLQKLSLIDKKSTEDTVQIDREDDYRETELAAKLVGMNMKQVAELLQQIEQTKRIYIKKLDIIKSKKNGLLEVEIIFATLLLKTE